MRIGFGIIAAVGLGLLLTACGPATSDLQEPIEPLGDFKLGHAVVVAKDAQKVPPSRDASAEEWQEAIGTALKDRFGRFEGEKFYHVAVSVDGYSIAVPGVPLVLAPKSVLVVSATVWDDAAGAKINAEPKQITVLERLSGATAISSGLTQSREQQIQNLAENAARLIENWLRSNPGWFDG